MDRSAAQAKDDEALSSLAGLRAAENACRRCPLYRDATQAVPGEGRRDATLMLVGEQPGDQEDRTGKPFVGPAGRMLDRALKDAGIERDRVFVTNAVKHFKHEMRGKRRLHKKPNAGEIDRCRWWLDLERSILKPVVIVAMGTTAVRGVLGRAATIASLRGRALPLDGGAVGFVTIHPSALLHTEDAADRAQKYHAFVVDLRRAATRAASAG